MARNTYFMDEVVKHKFSSKQLLRILRYAIPYKKTFLTALLFMALSIVINMLPAMLIKHIIDTVAPTGDYGALYALIGAFLLIGFADITFNFINGRLMGSTGHNIIYGIRNDIFTKLQSLSFDYFDNRPAGKILVRVTGYVDELAGFFANQLLNFIVSISRMLVVLVFLFILNATLALVVLATALPIGLFVFLIRKVLKSMFSVARNKGSNRSAYISENILGVSVTKSYNRIKRNENTMLYLSEDSGYQWRGIIAVNETYNPGIDIFWNLGQLAIFGTALALILSGTAVQTGTVLAFFSYLGMFTQPLNQLAHIFQQLAQISSNLERIFDTIDTPDGIGDKDGADTLPDITGNVSFEDVTFTYDGEVNILEHFNLEVPAGKTIALVGPTGAGKSTVVNLIPRFYDVSGGAVRVDGHDVRDVTLHSLRSQMGIMMQDSFIFKGTVMDNIRYANENASDEQCMAAARSIFADDFIKTMPNGYMTELAERGEGLSSGEKQLISFARVMVCNPKILILDEATSSIDTATEKKIQQALDVMLKGRTSFIIAHRLSTIRKADCILYIADKGIAEAGTHDQLMDKKGLYYALNSKH